MQPLRLEINTESLFAAPSSCNHSRFLQQCVAIIASRCPAFYYRHMLLRSASKSRRRIDPQHQRFGFSRILPMVFIVAFKIKAVAFFELMCFAVGQGNVEL